MLSRKHARFVSEYLKDLSAVQAAIRAGYSKKTARVQGPRLLSNAAVAKAVAEGSAKQLAKNDLTADRILEEMRRLALFDIRDYFTKDGKLKPITDISEQARSAIAGFEVARANLNPKDGKMSEEWLHKIKLNDKTKSLEMLAKYFGLLTEKVDLNVTMDATLLAKIQKARARLGEKK